MLIAAIQAENGEEAKAQIDIVKYLIDGFELRLDYWKELDFLAVRSLCAAYDLPVIFTLRKKSQGGFYQQDEAARLKTILQLCELNPDYFDFESEIPHDFVEQVHARYPNIQLICSQHFFENTPEDLNMILKKMQHAAFSSYKIAAMAQSNADVFRMLELVRGAAREAIALTGISMGTYGMITRIVGPLIGNLFTYASVDAARETAPGQLSVAELCDTYCYRELAKLQSHDMLKEKN